MNDDSPRTGFGFPLSLLQSQADRSKLEEGEDQQGIRKVSDVDFPRNADQTLELDVTPVVDVTYIQDQSMNYR